MSRFTLICSLVFGLSAALVQPAAAQFATAPPTTQVAMLDAAVADVPLGPELRVAPQRRVSRKDVRAALVKARAANLATFRAYQKKGVFPSNTFSDRQLNVWIDADGNLCAAATMIKLSGNSDLVTRIGEQNNFIRLGDVKQGPVMDWILTSGFTQDEIALIQEPFMSVAPNPSMEPSNRILVDHQMRKTEDARLRAKYRAIEKRLVKAHKKSIERAVDRLMKRQDLAWKLAQATAG